MWINHKALFLSMVFIFISLNPLHAEKVNIEVNLSIDTSSNSNSIGVPYYKREDIITLKSTVKNNSDKAYRVSDNFLANSKKLNIRLISPSGKLLLPVLPYDDVDKYDLVNPPLGYVFYKGRFIQPIPCDYFKSREIFQSTLKNIGKYYDLSLPGIYSVQYQVSAMIFGDNVCDLHNLRWQGLLRSNTLYFFYEGETYIDVYPKTWRTSWIKKPNNQLIEVKVTLPNKKLFQEVNIDSFLVNANELKYRTKRIENELSYILFFNPTESIAKILAPYRGIFVGYHPFVLYGKFKSGVPFGGAFLVEVSAN